MRKPLAPFAALILLTLLASPSYGVSGNDDGINFFERKIRPILVENCYECHSEEAGERQGGLLLDRKSGWLAGGETNKAVIPGQVEDSLLIVAVRSNTDLQMPPDNPLSPEQIKLLESWVQRGAPAPEDESHDSEFSRLGDQNYLFETAKDHWAFQPVAASSPPTNVHPTWNRSQLDRFILATLETNDLTPSPRADPQVFIRRLYYSTIGLPPSWQDVERFEQAAALDWQQAVDDEIEHLLGSPQFGVHLGRMWLDVARYADTDSFYRPDTKTPHYFPFAFSYRDYVVDSFNEDKPFDQFVKEQLAADLMGFSDVDPEIAALGFLAVGPHANRSQTESLDDWIDLTTRGLMGMTAACARCHDHKFEPIPTADYYSLRGVFASLVRIDPLDEKSLPELSSYPISDQDRSDYAKQRKAIDAKIDKAGSKKAGGNNRSVAVKIRETELAQLLAFHPGAPARAMIVKDRARPVPSFILIRGDQESRGAAVPRRFLKILDSQQAPFSDSGSGRLELAQKITATDNPLTARVIVNRVWGHVIGTHLVATPSDFGLQGSPPSHPELLDWLTADFIAHGWSIKHLVRQILTSETFQQSSKHRDSMAAVDPENRFHWRAHRRHLSIEAIRDSMLHVSGNLDLQLGGRPGMLWEQGYTKRRALYGYINRFNLDPTLRAFDFPTPMQSQPGRGESIVAPQALFTLNAPFVIDQATEISRVVGEPVQPNRDRMERMFQMTLQRQPSELEIDRITKFIESQSRFEPTERFPHSPWVLAAQALLMSNEFQYLD